MKATLDHIEDVANGIKTFWFKSSARLDYIAGQYIELYLPHSNLDNRGEKRWFTLSSSPSEELISITTKIPTARISTFKQALLDLKHGDIVTVSEAMGDFVLPIDKTVPLVFAVGGIGVTPVRSMIKWLIDARENRNLQIIYSVSESAELAFLDIFEHYGISPHVILSSTNEKLDGAKVLEIAETNEASLLYVSGPELFVERLGKDLIDVGIRQQNLVLDFYHGYKS